MIQFSEIAQIVEGTIINQPINPDISYLLIDSRKIDIPERSIFFAISGHNHDGHQYINELVKKQVKAFIVEKDIVIDSDEVCVVKVASSIKALQSLAAWHRQGFAYPVIGITGSNGKTIVKEWLAQLLANDFRIVKSPKSYNSQVGVPLSVWGMDKHHSLAIFEAGISQMNEMANLQKVIQPTIGIFTNIGTAHEEGFESIEAKTREKLKLFSNCQTIICCQEHHLIQNELRKAYPDKKLFTWSFTNKNTDVYIEFLSQDLKGTRVCITYKGIQSKLRLPFIDDASIENCMHGISTALYLGIDYEALESSLGYLQPISMRLELKKSLNACYLIDDSYNNDLVGLRIALNFLNQQNQTKFKTLILSDLLEANNQSDSVYHELSSLIKAHTIYRFIGIGSELGRHKHLFDNAIFYPNTQSFLQDIPSLNFQHETILIKGARKFQFEKIVSVLQQKVHGTKLEVNLDALVHNLNYYKSQLQPETKIMVMVKALAYGNGSYEIANLLQLHRVDYLGVAYADEGIELRQHGIYMPIMVMNPEKESFEKLSKYNLEPEIYSFKILEEYLAFLKASQILSSNIHLKLDTGMHRLGFEHSEIDKLVSTLKGNPHVRLASIFSHLAAADEAQHHLFSSEQYSLFGQMCSTIEQQLGYSTIKHILNSAGIVRYPQWQMNMVRLGIGIYGIEATGMAQERLSNVGKLITHISQIKSIEPGQTVGYSRKGKIDKVSKIATIAIGYADGYDRRFSNGIGKVWVNGTLCPVIGNVCMDMTMVDISKAIASEGDEVEIFGQNILISDLAKSIGTIPYEILTNVSARVKRVFFSE